MLQTRPQPGGQVNTTLKYQHIIDEQKLSAPCPNNCSPIDKEAFRFVDAEQVTADHFLPTIIEDKKNGIVRRSNDEISSCKKCSISLYSTEKKAIGKLKTLSQALRNKWTKNYIAKGFIVQQDGLASTIDEEGHFSFYEFIQSNIYINFTVTKTN